MADILIVDDSPDTARVLSRLLRLHGHAADCQADGAAALAYLGGGRRPDLVILDYMMPGLSGLDVLARIRQDPRLADLPVILYTAAGDPAVERRGRDLGAVDVVTKGGGWDALFPRLRPYLG